MNEQEYNDLWEELTRELVGYKKSVFTAARKAGIPKSVYNSMLAERDRLMEQSWQERKVQNEADKDTD